MKTIKENGEETGRYGGQRWLLHQWEGRCFQYVALYLSVLEAYRRESGQLTTSLLCSSGRKGKFLCRAPTCTTT